MTDSSTESAELSARMRAMRAKRPMIPIEDRFWSKIEPEPNSGCWIWIGARVGEGYGALGRGRVVTRSENNRRGLLGQLRPGKSHAALQLGVNVRIP